MEHPQLDKGPLLKPCCSKILNGERLNTFLLNQEQSKNISFHHFHSTVYGQSSQSNKARNLKSHPHWKRKSKTVFYCRKYFNLCRKLNQISKKPMCAKLLQLWPTLSDPMVCNPPGYSIHGILQARILDWVAILLSRRSSWPRDWTCVSYVCCNAGGFFTSEAPLKPIELAVELNKNSGWRINVHKLVVFLCIGNETEIEIKIQNDL